MIIEIVICGIYVLLIFILYYVLKTEKADIMCPEGPNTVDKSVCREGNGKSYAGSQPSKDPTKDKIATLLQKIEIAAKAPRKDVLWRRAFIGCCIGFLLFSAIMRRIPTVPETILLFITMVIIYGIYSCYNYHHYRHIEDNIVASTEEIKRRLLQKGS
jgi:hypothetical protein